MNMKNRQMFLAVGALAGLLMLAGAVQRPALAEFEQEGEDEFVEHIEMFQMALELMNTMTDIAEDESRTAVMAVMTLEDHTATQEEAVTVLERMLKRCEDPTVQRAIRIKLTELYGDTERPDRALENLQRLILDQPGA